MRKTREEKDRAEGKEESNQKRERGKGSKK